MTNDLRQLVTRFLQAMFERDAETLSEVLAEDATWLTPPSTMPQFRGPHAGREAILALVVGAGATMFVEGTVRSTIQRLLVDGDQAAAEFRVQGTMSAGPSYDNVYAFFFRLAGGRIAEISENIDTAYAYARMSVEPAWVTEL